MEDRNIKNLSIKKNEIKDKNCPRVVFWSSSFILFRSTLIGNLFEISQVYPTVLLLGEEGDSETKRILSDKKKFPKLQKIIFCQEPFYGKALAKNRHIYRTIKKTLDEFKPDIVVSAEDFYPGSMYLMRLARKKGLATVAIQAGFKIAERKKLYLWSCLVNSHTRMPGFLPISLRLFLVKLKKYFGYFFYHWVLPLSVGEAPFWGKTSFIFWNESSGLRDADYSVVFSRRDHDLCIKDGVPSEKIFILNHPLIRNNTEKLFKKIYFSNSLSKEKAHSKTLTVMLSAEKIGFKKENYSLIPEKEMQEIKVRVVTLIASVLKGWNIFIKPYPHPEGSGDLLGASEVKKSFESVSEEITVVDPFEPAGKYIERSDVVLGIPPPSTTLFIASLQRPEKIVLSLNMNKEFLGDAYKDFNGIEYIDNEKDFINILSLIRDNKYHRKPETDKDSTFSSTDELLDYVYSHHLEKKETHAKHIS